MTSIRNMKNIDRKKKDEFSPDSESNLIDKNGVTDSQKVENIPIDKIESIISVNFKEDDIERFSKSINEIGCEPAIVRPIGNGKYQLCSHPKILEAYKFLGEKKIDCIIQDISEQQGKELSIASILSNPEISAKEHEFIVWELFTTGYETGEYKSKADCARKIGIPDTQVSYLCYGKEQREKLFGPDGPSDHISTDTLRFIKHPPNDEQKLFCDRIFDGNISPSEVREAVKYIKSESKDSKRAILTGVVPFRKAKEVIEQRFSTLNELYSKAEKKLRDPKTRQKIIQDEIPNITSEPFRVLAELFGETRSTYIENIPDETERKQADFDLNIISVLVDELRYKRGLITLEKYKERIGEVGFTPEDVESLKEDGHRYGFSDEWLTRFEEKFQEKLRKLDTCNDPLAV
ncbi:MAG TPA: ParB N-terminal domain-containing protein [Candidatus Glassbacteria bacterium]|nr:ParB N-terminal domain-containing protein [Candidatus Glassbacteria bacterium]